MRTCINEVLGDAPTEYQAALDDLAKVTEERDEARRERANLAEAATKLRKERDELRNSLAVALEEQDKAIATMASDYEEKLGKEAEIVREACRRYTAVLGRAEEAEASLAAATASGKGWHERCVSAEGELRKACSELKKEVEDRLAAEDELRKARREVDEAIGKLKEEMQTVTYGELALADAEASRNGAWERLVDIRKKVLELTEEPDV